MNQEHKHANGHQEAIRKEVEISERRHAERVAREKTAQIAREKAAPTPRDREAWGARGLAVLAGRADEEMTGKGPRLRELADRALAILEEVKVVEADTTTLQSRPHPVAEASALLAAKVMKVLPFEDLSEAQSWVCRNLRLTEARKIAKSSEAELHVLSTRRHALLRELANLIAEGSRLAFGTPNINKDVDRVIEIGRYV